MSTSASRRWPSPLLVAPPNSRGWATRSPSSRRTSMRRPRGFSSSSTTSTRAPAGTPASARVPSGCREETARRHTSRALHVYQYEDGMVVIRGRLAPEVGAVLIQALTAAREALYQKDVSAEPPTMPQQQADALALVAETALHHGIDPGAR